jgi:hypothetical protein
MGKKLHVKELMDVLIYVLFASVVLPIIAINIRAMTGDSGNFSASEIVVLGLITTLIVLGVAYAIIKTLF